MMEEEYENENVMENIDDEDEEMVNEDFNGEKQLDPNQGGDNISPPNITIKPPGTKQKRRSKNDCNGRDYVCGCGKTYLSYPALYTHIKTKHNGKTPDGTNANQIQNGKGRGRPRKNFLINEDVYRRGDRLDGIVERNPEFNEMYNKKNNSNEYAGGKEELYLNIYSALGLLGSVRDPLSVISPLLEEKNKTNNKGYSLLHTKIKFILDNKLYDKLLNLEEIKNFMPKDKESMTKNNLSYENITCDDIFALFIISCKDFASSLFLKSIVIFMKNLRDCMNLLGWDILAQYKQINHEPSWLEFTTVHNAEILPEISNEFVNSYLPNHLPAWDKHLAVVIVNHFCDWLYQNRFTHKKIKFLN